MRPVLVSILLLGAVCHCASSSRFSAQEPTFRVGVTDIQLNPEVLEAGRPVENLQQSEFLLFDEDQPQSILYFARESVPLDLVLLLDVSGSVQKYFRAIAGIASEALSSLKPEDRVAVMLFSRDVWIEQSFTSDHAEISDAIGKAAGEAPPGSGTRIYAAVRSAVRYLAAQQPDEIRRRAILILTDNDAMSYDVHREEVLRSLYSGAVTFDAIVVGRHPHPPAARSGAAVNPDFAFDDVFPLADQTGGEAIATTKPNENLSAMLKRIRDRYVIAYHPPADAVPDSFHHVRVELGSKARKNHPHAVVRCRAGYYVSGSAQPVGSPGDQRAQPPGN
jgi:VWFA-related protein